LALYSIAEEKGYKEKKAGWRSTWWALTLNCWANTYYI
jgi:hypothetical protein